MYVFPCFVYDSFRVFRLFTCVPLVYVCQALRFTGCCFGVRLFTRISLVCICFAYLIMWHQFAFLILVCSRVFTCVFNKLSCLHVFRLCACISCLFLGVRFVFLFSVAYILHCPIDLDYFQRASNSDAFAECVVSSCASAAEVACGCCGEVLFC